MSASGFTPIQLYRSTTAAAVPLAANLAAGELAINLTDEKLYFENASGVVKVLADSTYVGTVTSVNASGGTTGMTFSGGPVTGIGTLTLAGTLAVANGGTGVTTSTGTTSVVLSNSPVLVTPTLGVASATSIAAGLGAVGTPSYTFTGDTNTGMFSPAADTIAFSEGGVEAMRIDSSGNVGIGTSSPGVRFDVTGQGRLGNGVAQASPSATDIVSTSHTILGGQGGNALFVGQYPTTFAAWIQSSFTNPTTATYNLVLQPLGGNVGIGTATPAQRLHVRQDQNGTTAALIQNRNGSGTPVSAVQFISGAFDLTDNRYAMISSAGGSNTTLQFWTGSGATPTERMRITDTGNVGIGTSTPEAVLDINGSQVTRGDASGFVYFAPKIGTTPFGANYDRFEIRVDPSTQVTLLGNVNGGTGAARALAFLAGTNERMRIDTAGNVGIGTTAPSFAKLQVSNAGAEGFEFSPAFSAGVNRILSYNRTTNAWNTLRLEGSSQEFYVSGTERMRVASSGNVGIGTSAPSYTLQVNASSGSNNVAYFVNDSVGSTLAGIVASIESGGNNTNSFHFAGVTQTVALWYLYGNGTTSYTSDIRVKKNVTTTRDGYLEDVCKLRVVKYNWYNDSDDTPRELGFIAQEVEQVFPGLVQDALHPTKDGEIHKVLKGSVMMPIMLKALQEANAKIDALTARVAQLEGN